MDIYPIWDFFIQTLIVNKDEFLKIRFLYFWNIGQYPLEFNYKHVLKSKMQENNFCVVFKKSMRKHIFKNFKYLFFLYKKNIKNMLEYWPYTIIFFFISIKTPTTQLNQLSQWKKNYTRVYSNSQEAWNNSNPATETQQFDFNLKSEINLPITLKNTNPHIPKTTKLWIWNP